MKEIFAIAGFALLVGGCAWHYLPLGLIVGGVVLLLGGLAAHFSKEQK